MCFCVRVGVGVGGGTEGCGVVGVGGDGRIVGMFKSQNNEFLQAQRTFFSSTFPYYEMIFF
jgi:hypothetical protein